MGKTSEIRKLYEGMTSAQIAERLASGEISDTAVKIGTQILADRGENPELAIEQASVAIKPEENVLVIKGRNGKICPFCHGTDISSFWSPVCKKCGATYDNNKIERAIFVSAMLMAIKGSRLDNQILFFAGIAGLVIGSGIAISRGTLYGTWYRNAEPELPKPF